MNMRIRSRTLLLDTNLLLLLFIGGKNPSLIQTSKTLSAFIEDDYDLLKEVISENSFNQLVTTPHIMTEVSNLLGKDRGSIPQLGREAMAEFLMKCREHVDSSALLVSDPTFYRLGLTDVAISVVSKLPAFVLTVDADLYFHVSKAGLEAENFNPIRQGSWQ